MLVDQFIVGGNGFLAEEALRSVNRDAVVSVHIPELTGEGRCLEDSAIKQGFSILEGPLRDHENYLLGLPSIVIASFWQRELVPESITSKHFCLNLHFGALPKYAGKSPLFWAIANGECHVGITLHKMDGSFDTGPILSQTLVSLTGPKRKCVLPTGRTLEVYGLTAEEAFIQANYVAAGMFRAWYSRPTFNCYKGNGKFEYRDRKAVVFEKDCHLSQDLSDERLECLIRAFTFPSKNTWPHMNGRRLELEPAN